MRLRNRSRADAKPLRERRRLTHQRRWWQNPWLYGATATAVVVLIAYFYFAPLRSASAAMPSGSELSTVQYAITHIREGVFEEVGDGGLQNPIKAMKENQTRFGGADPRPQLLYMGAEFCSTCAAQRWSLIAALSRFGEFTALNPTKSAGGESCSELPTFTFYRAQYDSPYLSFIALETADRNKRSLQKPSEDQRSLMSLYTTQNTPAPFISFGNRYYTVGSGYEMRLISDKGWTDITAGLNDPTNSLTRAVVGNANYITAGICKLTNNQPEAVCSSPAISLLSAKIT